MKLFNLKVSSVLLFFSFFRAGFCTECLELETDVNIEGFDTKKAEGKYEVVMSILDNNWPDPKSINCNEVTVLQHVHPKGGVNLAISVEANNEMKSFIDLVLPHFNSSTDIYGVEKDKYDHMLKKWFDIYYKILMLTDDLLVISYCFNNEDDQADTRFYVDVYRKQGSKLPISTIKDMLPVSIKDKEELVNTCDR